jgi:sodium/potassium-transporting ATPase subunit alpha
LTDEFGHSNWNSTNEDEFITLGWDMVRSAKMDARLFYSFRGHRKPEDWTNCRWPTDDKDFPKFYRYSSVSNAPICYTTESLKYAQTAYLVSIVTVQISGLLATKARNLSLYQQGMNNFMSNVGIVSEIAMVSFLAYVQPLNLPIGTRQIASPHFGVPSLSFFVAILMYDELRKIFVRKGMTKEDGMLKLRGWVVQNTYY